MASPDGRHSQETPPICASPWIAQWFCWLCLTCWSWTRSLSLTIKSKFSEFSWCFFDNNMCGTSFLCWTINGFRKAPGEAHSVPASWFHRFFFCFSSCSNRSLLNCGHLREQEVQSFFFLLLKWKSTYLQTVTMKRRQRTLLPTSYPCFCSEVADWLFSQLNARHNDVSFSSKCVCMCKEFW